MRVARRLGSILACLTMSTLACSGVTSKTNSYATLDDARTAGAISEGWIPEGLPAHAHDLREAHVPNSARRWGLFEYPLHEEGALRALLDPQEISLAGQRCDIPPRIEWWPVALRGSLDASRIATTGLQAYRSRRGDLIFAVNWRQGRAYYWMP
jgi:hypothetical protein